ncbi:MAG: cytochrome P450 [Paracoccus sp. (in: a-proteobacteria)]|uniref:cytochrome P450 n=1 Tax=Paracoccus sp. TaxID=267 RepID=UPI0039195A64
MSHLDQIDAAPESLRWPLVRGLMRDDPLGLYAELRAYRPVLVLPEVTLAVRHSDCTQILSRHDLFSVAPYRAKQGDYWMAQDDTARHWREKSVMRAILDVETVPDIRAFAEAETARRLDAAAGGTLDLVAAITRGVPIAVVAQFFGLTGADPAEMCDWSYWNQMDAFWNQPFDDPRFASPAEIIARREAANAAMRDYLIALVRERAAALQAGQVGPDMISRLLILAGSGAVRLDLPLVVLNAGGLLIGAVETTSHAVVNALTVLAADKARLAAAMAAANSDDPSAIDGFVFEALRFRPAFPYFFRRAEADTVLAQGTDHETRVPRGTMVLAVTHSAMFDPMAQATPERFDPRRGAGATFTFGYGLHECLGRNVGAALIPAIVRAVLRRDGARPGPVDYRNGPVPEAWPWQIPPGCTDDTPAPQGDTMDDGLIVTSPTADLEQALADIPSDTAFRVVNFLKFHPVARYPEGYDGPPVSGAEAYWGLYIAGMAPIVREAGARLVHRSKAFGTIAGLPGEEWDEVAIFEWPDVAAMIRMSQHPTFIELSIHRIAATQNMRMVPMSIA